MTTTKCFIYGHDLTNHGHIQVCKRCGLTGGYENPYFEGFFIGVLPYARYIRTRLTDIFHIPAQNGYHHA